MSFQLLFYIYNTNYYVCTLEHSLCTVKFNALIPRLNKFKSVILRGKKNSTVVYSCSRTFQFVSLTRLLTISQVFFFSK